MVRTPPAPAPEVEGVRTDPAQVSLLIGDGEDLAREGKNTEASRCFLAALEVDTHNPRAWNGLGVCTYALGDVSASVEAFVSALRAEPRYQLSLSNLSDLLWDQGLRARVVPLARTILEEHPGDETASLRLRALGVEEPLPRKAIIFGKADTEGEWRGGVEWALSEAGFLVTEAWPEMVALLEPSEGGEQARRTALERYLDLARPSLLVVSATADEAEELRAVAATRGLVLAMIGLDAASPRNGGEYALPGGGDGDLLLASIQAIVDSGAIPASPPLDTTPEPLVSVIVRRPDPDIRLVDMLDRVLLQDLDSAILEVLLIDPGVRPPTDEDLKATHPPCQVRVIGEEAEIAGISRGRISIEIAHKDLLDHDALRRRILEDARMRPLFFSGENITPRSAAPAVALVRGWDQTDQTVRCLRSLRRDCTPDELRIIYVDNGSEAGSFASLAREFLDVEFVRFPENRGSCRGINAGMAMAAVEPHEFVLLLDNDTEVPEGDHRWLERWTRSFKEPDVGAAGAVSYYVAGQQQAEHTPETYARAWANDGQHGGAGRVTVPVLVSFAVMFRRKALEDIGWLADERFEPGNCEDFDLCLRMAEKGWSSVIAQSVWIHHRGSQTFWNHDFRGLLMKNQDVLIDKYGRARLSRLGLEVVHAG
jgi:GT2 family glycosyltransferase